jgi:recombination protein RecA
VRTVSNGAGLAASMSQNAGAATRVAALGARLDRAGLSQAADVLRSVRAVPTFFPWVDTTLGVGGWPTDGFTLVHGPSNKGKSVFTLGLCAAFVALGHPALYLDAERSTPFDWVLRLMGVHATSPLFRAKKPESYEQTVELTRMFCEAVGDAKAKGEVDPDTTALVVVDSIRKLMPKKLLDSIMKEFGDGKNARNGVDGMGGRAAQIKAAINAAWADELTALLDQTGTGLVAIGREYKNTDTSQWAAEYKLGGGDALFFEAKLVVRITESGQVIDEKTKALYATEHAVEIKKTKIAGKEERYPRAFFHLATGIEDGVPYGFDRARDVLHLARHIGIIGDGGWYPFEGDNLGQGIANALLTIRSNPALMQRIEIKCRIAKMPVDASVEVVTQDGPVVVQEGGKVASVAPKAKAAPRKRAAAGKATPKGGKGKKR